MKLDNSFAGQEWATAFPEIVERTKDGLEPILIVRSDNPDAVNKMRLYINSQKHTIYIKLGVICSMDKIYCTLFEKLKCNPNQLRREHNQTIAVIIKKIKTSRTKPLIIIDNCHFFAFDQIQTLMGLMLELSGICQFVLLLSGDYMRMWRSKSREFGANLFYNYLRHKYELDI